MRSIPILSIACACALALPAAAQMPASLRDSGDAAHLFAYMPKPGQRDRFDAGYRAHLQWHRGQRDPLVWYGWYVDDGEHAGMFVDGSFGAPFAAFDARVDAEGDGADAARNVMPHADARWRSSYRLRRELSTGFPLEQWRPTSRMQVVHYRVHMGMRRRFERAVAAARSALVRDRDAPAYTWYERVAGGGTPEYLLTIARADWASYDRHVDDLEVLVADGGGAQADALLADLAASVSEADTETWEYRPDLSLIPDR
jgi:hypothetical protein